MDPITTALSGMSAAATRLGVSASNVANSQSTVSTRDGQMVNSPYVPKQVEQQTQGSGGVSTSLRDVSPPSVPVFAPENPTANAEGIVQVPNVDMTQEAATQMMANHAYKANLNVMKRADEMYQSVLDMQS